MSIWTGKDDYNPIRSFESRTQRELLDRGVVFRRDTEPPPDEVEWVKRQLYMKDDVLELGCGLGVWSQVAAEVGCHYVGIDPVRERVSYASTHYTRYGQFSVGDARRFRCGRKFHCVLLVTVLQHVPMEHKIEILNTAAVHLLPGDVAILLESMILDITDTEAEAMYARPEHPCHMIPAPLGLLKSYRPEFKWHNDGVHDRWILERV